jgi:hypothetical protein
MRWPPSGAPVKGRPQRISCGALPEFIAGVVEFGLPERLPGVDTPWFYGSNQMRYLCLVYVEQGAFDGMSESAGKDLTRDSLAYDEELRRGGHYIESNALQDVDSATTLRVRNGKLSMTDGPFAETKEHLGGFILIEAKDLNEAIQLGSKIPMARFGSIEVRPIRELE